MKEGWTYKKLGEVVDNLRTGLNPRVHFRLNTTDAKGYYITVRELKGFSFIVDDRTDRINDYAIKRINERSNLKIGDVLYSGTGTIGRTALVQELPTWWNIKEGVYALTPKHDILDSSFLIYAMHSESFSNKVLSRTSGATVRSIPMKELKEIVISFPSLSEQKRIVERLDAAFENIDKLKANAEKQLAEAQTLFQKCLAKAMEPKEGWEEKKLNAIVHPDCTLSYGIVQPGDDVGDGIPVVRPVDFSNGLIVHREGLKRTKKEISDAYQRTILKGGEILLCVRGTTGTMGIASDELEGCNVTRGIVPLYFDLDVCSKFVYYELLSPSLQDEIAHKTTGAALKQINIKDLRNLNISIPPLAEQQRIVERLDALSENIRKYEEIQRQIISECDALKQALLRKVFE